MTVRVPTVPLLLYLYDFIAIGASVAWQEGRVDVMRVKCFIVLGNFRRACSVTAAGRRPDASPELLCAGKALVQERQVTKSSLRRDWKAIESAREGESVNSSPPGENAERGAKTLPQQLDF